MYPKKQDFTRCYRSLFLYLQYLYLLYEYRDVFIDMAVRNNRSELAIANRHQERYNFISEIEKSSFAAFHWTNDVSSQVKNYRSAF